MISRGFLQGALTAGMFRMADERSLSRLVVHVHPRRTQIPLSELK